MVQFFKTVFTICICGYYIRLTCGRIIDWITAGIKQMYFDTCQTIFICILYTIFVLVIPYCITQGTAHYWYSKGIRDNRQCYTCRRGTCGVRVIISCQVVIYGNMYTELTNSLFFHAWTTCTYGSDLRIIRKRKT